MKTKIQTLKGFRDFLPEDALKREWLKQKLIKIFEIWGYDPVETPILEPLEIFEGEIGEGEQLFYKFTDAGGRKVVLRYDQSAPIARLVGSNFQKLAMPFRRYQIQPTFRAEKPQKGRYREFLQCDADIFGISSPLADAEVIGLSLDIYRRLGFEKAIVLINDRSLLKDIPYKALVAIDKLNKIGEAGVIQEMVKKKIKKDDAQKFLTIVKNLKPNATIKTIFNYLDKMGFDKSWYQFEPTLARSFSYSSGPIWEVLIPEFKAGSVLGGERFDNLIKRISGNDIPATGFGLGFDRTLEAAEMFNLIPQFKTKSQVLITIFSPELFDNAIKATKELRQAGINTELYPDENTKLDKQLKYADKKGIPYALIVGPEEVKQDLVILKNLKQKKQDQLTIKQVINKLSK